MVMEIVCDTRFVPCMETVSEKLQISPDVAGATFMAFGNAAPEICLNLIATFSKSESIIDVGTGAVVGSGLFALLVIVSGEFMVGAALQTPDIC